MACVSTQARLWGHVVLISALATGCGPRPDKVRNTVEIRRFPDGGYEKVRKRDGLVEGRVLSYSATGDLQASQYYHRDTLNGPVYRFYADGLVFVREEARGGLLNGFSCVFTRHGRVGLTRYMVNGQRVGSYRVYYDGPAPRLREAIDFVSVAGEEYANFTARYDSLGHLVARTGRVVMQSDRDTVAAGDTLLLHLRIEHPQHKESGLSTGDYDAQFVLRTPASERRGRGIRHRFTLKVPTVTRGADTVRGYVEDFDVISPASSKDEVMVRGRKLYFAHPYFVK